MRYKKGGALISALFITALAAILATALAMQQRLLIHEGSLIIDADQDYLNLQGEQLTAKNYIVSYVQQFATQNAMQSFVPLVMELPTVKINNTTIGGHIENEQGKFNVNDLQSFQNQWRFVALLRAVDTAVSSAQALAIAKSITAWMTTGSDDQYYLSLHPAYRSSQTQMANTSELRLIKGVTPAIFQAVEPYVTALPENMMSMIPVTSPQPSQPAPPSALTVSGIAIDVNAASAPVLLTLNPTVTLAQAQDIVNCRQQQGGFTNTQLFMTQCAKGMTLNNITVQSRYFSVHSSGIAARSIVQLKSLLVTQMRKNNTLKVQTVWQSFF